MNMFKKLILISSLFTTSILKADENQKTIAHTTKENLKNQIELSTDPTEKKGKAETTKANDYGAGNGGDAIIIDLPASYQPRVYESMVFKTESYFDYLSQNSSFNKIRRKLYALDFVDFGIEDKIEIRLNGEIKEDSDVACILNFGCYQIENSELFDALIDYDDIFGVAIDTKSLFPRKEFAFNLSLRNLFDEFESNRDKYSEIFWDNREDDVKSDELLQAEAVLNTSKAEYLKAVNKAFRNRREYLYDSRVLLAIAVINKIQDIKKVDAVVARRLSETLIDLDWINVSKPLKEIEDEGHVDVILEGKFQIASRRNGIVKISNEGWNEVATIGGEEVRPLDLENRVGVIFHEVVYEMTEKQGDVDSERARTINALLFKSNKTSRYIKKAIKLLDQK